MMMKYIKEMPELIDLGTASIETKGVARFNQDTDGGERDLIPGVLAD
jgi:hypothetical protein